MSSPPRATTFRSRVHGMRTVCRVLALCALLAVLADTVKASITYTPTTFTTDGHNHSITFPRSTAVFPSDGAIAIYHYGVNGQYGQGGVSIISSTGQHLASLWNITTSGTGVSSPFQFVNQSEYVQIIGQGFALVFPYTATLVIDNNDLITVQTVWRMANDSANSTWGILATVTMDRLGRFVSVGSAPLTNPVPTVNGHNVTGSGSSLVVGNTTVGLLPYWSMAYGCINIVPDSLVVDSANNIIFYALSTTNNPNDVMQAVLVVDSTSLTLVGSVNIGFAYTQSAGSPYMYWTPRLSISPVDNSVVAMLYHSIGDTGGIFAAVAQVVKLTPTVTDPTPLSLQAGDVSDLFYTSSFGYVGGVGLQGTAVFPSDSAVAVGVLSGVPFGISGTGGQSSVLTQYRNSASTRAIVVTLGRTVVSTITNITDLTPAALAAGLSDSISNYFIVAMYADNNDMLYLSNYRPLNGSQSSIIIIDRTGRFVDFFAGFVLPLTPFVDKAGNLVVTDSDASTITVINQSNHSVIHSISVPSVIGVCGDAVNDGYIVTSIVNLYYFSPSFTSPFVRLTFFDSHWNNASASVRPMDIGVVNAYLSGPVNDREGRVYYLSAVNQGQYGAPAGMVVADTRNRTVIQSYNQFYNGGYKRSNGISQLPSVPTLSIDVNTQAIVAATYDLSQLVHIVPFVTANTTTASSTGGGGGVAVPSSSGSSTAAQLSSSSSSNLAISSSAAMPSSSTVLSSSSTAQVSSSSSAALSSSSQWMASSSSAVSSSSTTPSVSSALSSSSTAQLSSSSGYLSSSSQWVLSSSSSTPLVSSVLSSSSTAQVSSSSSAVLSSSSQWVSSSASAGSSSLLSSSSSSGTVAVSSSASGASSSSSTVAPSSTTIASSSAPLLSSSSSSSSPAPVTSSSLAASSASQSSLTLRSSSSSTNVPSTAASTAATAPSSSSSLVNNGSSSSSSLPASGAESSSSSALASSSQAAVDTSSSSSSSSSSEFAGLPPDSVSAASDLHSTALSLFVLTGLSVLLALVA